MLNHGASDYLYRQTNHEDFYDLNESYLGESSPDDDTEIEFYNEPTDKLRSTAHDKAIVLEQSQKWLSELDSCIERGDWQGLVTSVRKSKTNENMLQLLSEDSRWRITEIETLVENDDWEGVIEVATRINTM